MSNIDTKLNDIEVFLKECVCDVLKKSGGLYTFKGYWLLSCAQTIHTSLRKKDFIKTFGDEKALPPYLPMSYNAIFLEKVFKILGDVIMIHVSQILKKYWKNEKICFTNPLPILIFSPIIHSLQFQKNTRIRYYGNPYIIKNVRESIDFLKRSVSFVCLKNSLVNIHDEQETPLYHLELSEHHIKFLFEFYFKEFITKGNILDIENEYFHPKKIWGFIKGCCYANTQNIDKKQSILKQIKNDEARKGFLLGKRIVGWVDDIDEIPTWKKIHLKAGDVQSFDAKTNFFIFVVKDLIKSQGEFIALQQIHDLIEEKGERTVNLELPPIPLTQEESERLEMFHKKTLTLQEYIPGIRTNSILDGNPDELLQCPWLFSFIIGKKILT